MNSLKYNEESGLKYDLWFGSKCLKEISFSSLVDFMMTTQKVVRLDLSKLDFEEMTGCPEEVTEEDKERWINLENQKLTEFVKELKVVE